MQQHTKTLFISCFLLLCQHWYRRRRAVMHWVHSWNINCLEQFCICLLLLFWTSQHTHTYTLELYCRPAWGGLQKIFPSTISWRAIWEVARLGDFITRNQFFYYKCYICWKFKPIFALSYSQILRWPHAGAIISLQVQKKSAWMAWNNVWRFLWSPNVLSQKESSTVIAQ